MSKSKKVRARRFYIVMMVREVMFPVGGEVGFIPVFKTKREAKIRAAGKYAVHAIEESI